MSTEEIIQVWKNEQPRKNSARAFSFTQEAENEPDEVLADPTGGQQLNDEDFACLGENSAACSWDECMPPRPRDLWLSTTI